MIIAVMRLQSLLNPHMTPGAEVEPGPRWWKASALTAKPTLPPKKLRSLHKLRRIPNMSTFLSFLL